MMRICKTTVGTLLLMARLATQSPADNRQLPDPAFDTNAVMKSLAVAFRDIEKRLAPGSGDLAASTASLRKAAELVGNGQVERNEDLREEHLARSQRLVELASELEAAAAEPRLVLQEALENVRTACVACHVVFRDNNGSNRMFPARHNTISGEVTLLAKNREPLEERSNIVVFLDRSDQSLFQPPRKNPVISQKGRSFSPRVLPVLRGTAVDFPNDDDIFHNVFSLSKPCCFDLDIYDKGITKTVEFPKTGLVKVYCNLHPLRLHGAR